MTAVVAVIAAIFAGYQVKEARRTREAQSQPFVMVDIQPSRVWQNLLMLVVENIGMTLAQDVKITFTPALATSLADSALPQSVLLRDGIPALPPRRRIEVLFDVSHDRLAAKLPLRHDVVVTFKDHRGRDQEPLRYVVDLTFLYDLESVGERNLHHAAKALEEVNKTLKSWSSTRGLQVSTRSDDARARRDRIEFDLTGHHPSLGRRSPSDLTLVLAGNVLIRTLVRRSREVWRSLSKTRST